MSEELERIGVEAVFETTEFKKGSEAYLATLDNTNKKTAQAAAGMGQSMAKVSNEIDLAGKGWQGAVGDMLKMGASVQDVARMFNVSADEVRMYAQASSEVQTNAIQAAQAQQQQAAATEKVAAATKKAESYIGRYLKRMALWLTIGAAVRGVVRAITNNLQEGFKAVYENTEEYKNLAKASEEFRNSIVLSIAPLEQTLALMEKLADAANRWADANLRGAAQRATATEGMNAMFAAASQREMGGDQRGVQAAAELAALQLYWGTFEGMPGLQVSPEEKLKALEEINQKYDLGIDLTAMLAENLGEYEEAVKGTTDAEDDMAKATADLAEILRDTDEELDRHKQAISAIHAAYDEAAAQAMVDYYQESQKIAADAAAEIEKIEADALADIAKIRAKGEKRITDMINRAQKDRVNDEERHQLEMAFRRRRFELSQVQNERMYQARRRRLVGEGDVLAIEELDEQYELQKQAAEENFKLQMEQAEAMYQLQARVQEESMARQIQALREAMAEQIAEVEAAKAEEIAQVQAAALAEEEAAKQARDKGLYDAKVARDQDLADEEATHQERLVALGERFRQLEERYDLGLARITKAVQNAYGVGGEMDNAVRDAFERWKMYADQAAAYIAGTGYGGVVQSGGAGYYGGSYYGSPGRGPYGYQAGTSGWQTASSPTLIEVAENAPEMFNVQPMYGGGSASMSLSWTGGPIPLRGEGSLSGADLSQVASGITIAIMSRMKKSYQNMYAPGG